MIGSFADSVAEDVFLERGCNSLPTRIVELVLTSLQLLNAACELRDLVSIPRLQLHCLNPDGAADEFSLALRQDVRVLFVWRAPRAHGVRIAVLDG